MLCPKNYKKHKRAISLRSSPEEALFQVSDIPYFCLGSIMGHDGTIGEIAEWRLNQHLNFTNNMMINIVVNLIINHQYEHQWMV